MCVKSGQRLNTRRLQNEPVMIEQTPTNIDTTDTCRETIIQQAKSIVWLL